MFRLLLINCIVTSAGSSTKANTAWWPTGPTTSRSKVIWDANLMFIGLMFIILIRLLLINCIVTSANAPTMASTDWLPSGPTNSWSRVNWDANLIFIDLKFIILIRLMSISSTVTSTNAPTMASTERVAYRPDDLWEFVEGHDSVEALQYPLILRMQRDQEVYFVKPIWNREISLMQILMAIYIVTFWIFMSGFQTPGRGSKKFDALRKNSSVVIRPSITARIVSFTILSR